MARFDDKSDGYCCACGGDGGKHRLQCPRVAIRNAMVTLSMRGILGDVDALRKALGEKGKAGLDEEVRRILFPKGRR